MDNPLIKKFCDEYMEGNEFNAVNFEKYNRPIFEKYNTRTEFKSNDIRTLADAFGKFITISFNSCSEVAITDFINRFQYVRIYDNSDYPYAYTLENQSINGESPLIYDPSGDVKRFPITELNEVAEIVTYHRYPYYNALIKEFVCQLPSGFKESKYYYSSRYTDIIQSHDELTVKTKIYLRK